MLRKAKRNDLTHSEISRKRPGGFQADRSNSGGGGTRTPNPFKVGILGAPHPHGFDGREARGPGCCAFSGAERSDRREAEKLLSLYPGVDHAREKRDESKQTRRPKRLRGIRNSYVDCPIGITSAVHL